MKRHINRIPGIFLPLMALAVCSTTANAQVAVPEIEEIQEIPVISDAEIEELVGPIALYPDDLLAIVLPAATFPLQIVEAGRFLEELEDNPALEPDEDWDDAIVALLNYPEVVELMNEDLDWTWRLGEAVVGQQSDVILAIEDFRDRAYAAGNLQSDDYQLVAEEDGAIQITPVEEDVIYVPYYEPAQVVVYQPTPVYFYHPRPYPVYYYPYPSYYSFHDHFYHHRFWGVTTAFSIAWHSYNVSVYHHSFYGHPYYGRTYWNNYWYRRPDIHIHNNVYVRNTVNVSNSRYRSGDRWLPSDRRTVSYSDGRITRSRYYSDTTSRSTGSSTAIPSRTNTVSSTSGSRNRSVVVSGNNKREPVKFRPRTDKPDSVRPTTSRTVRSATPSRPTSDNIARVSEPQTKLTLRPSTPRVTSTAKPAPTRSSPSARPTTSRSSTPTRPTTSRSGNASSASRSSKPSGSSTSRSSSASKPSASRSSSSSKPSASRSSESRSRPTSRNKD